MKIPIILFFFFAGLLSVRTVFSQIHKPIAPKIAGVFSTPQLNEVSGIARSRLHPDIFYVHNDSGDSSRFFAITTKGKLITTYAFKGVADNKFGVRDCEDISVGPGPRKGKSYIYLADIGDNIGWRSGVQVYRFPEPALQKNKTVTLKAEVVNLAYPDWSRDAEAILVDPRDRIIYIISKKEDSVGIYKCSLDFKDGSKIVMQRSVKLFLEGSGSSKWIVAADISADGKQILIKTETNVYHWDRRENETVPEALLKRSPKRQTAYHSLGQEEAITFAAGNNGYYVTAEGEKSKIYFYPLEK